MNGSYPMRELGTLGVAVLDCEHRTPPATKSGHLYIAIPDIVGGRVNLRTARRISDQDLRSWTRRTRPRVGDVLVTRRGRVGDTAPIPANTVCAIGQNLVLLRSDGTNVDQGYLRWAARGSLWRSEVERLMNVGAVFSSLNVSDIPSIRVPVPPLKEQRAIAEVLGALDDKIAANDRVRQLLVGLSAATYDAALAGGSSWKKLDELAEFHNRRRIPLSSRERQARVGSVPYYGAAGRLGYVDEPIFSEALLLVGEDGSVVRDDGSPVVQYIWGPSWVNNHAHVLTGTAMSTEMLKVAVERSNVSHLVTGAVQPKISMSNLKSLELHVPIDGNGSDVLIQRLAASYRSLFEESDALVRVRDELLPLLMSGKVRVKDAEKVVEEVT